MGDIRLGIVGGGAVAQVIHLPLLRKITGVKVAALADQDGRKLQALGKQHGIDSLYEKYGDLINDPDIDVVDVCTNSESHFGIALDAINAGKNVMIEKPPTMDEAQAQVLAKTASANGKIVLAGMNNRFRADFMMLKSYISEKQLGEVFYINAAWHKQEPSTRMHIDSKPQSRRGVMLDLGVVLIDLALWLLDFPGIKGVNAALFSRRYKNMEDTALVTIRTSAGSMIRLDASWGLQQPDESFRFEVFGTNGTATTTPLILHSRMKDKLVSLTPVQNSKFENVFKRSYETELANFVRFLTGVQLDVPTIAQMCHVMKVVDAAYLSAKRENAVKL